MNSGNTRDAVRTKKLSTGAYSLEQLIRIDFDLVRKIVSFLEPMYKDTERIAARSFLVSEVYPLVRRCV